MAELGPAQPQLVVGKPYTAASLAVMFDQLFGLLGKTLVSCVEINPRSIPVKLC